MRKRGGRKRAIGTRAPLAIPQGPNQRWSLDFVSDSLSPFRGIAAQCPAGQGMAAVSGCSASLTTSAGNAWPRSWTPHSPASGLPVSSTISPERVAIPAWWSAITSYVGKFRLLRSAGHGASGAPDALTGLPRRALPSRNDLFHSKHRVRAPAALTVLNTRSQIPSRKPEHYLRGQRTASTAITERGPSAWAHPSKKGR